MSDLVTTNHLRLGRRALTGVALASAAVFMVGCSSSAKPAADGGAAAITTDGFGADSSAPPTGGGDDAKAAALDVCSMLTLADAQAIGTKTQLSSLPNVTYKLMTEKPEKTSSSSSCTLTIYNELPDGTSGNEAIVTMQVEPSKYLNTIGAKKISGGPGDAAYDDGGAEQVVSGDYLLKPTQSQGASDELIDGMIRAMIPNLKTQLASS